MVDKFIILYYNICVSINGKGGTNMGYKYYQPNKKDIKDEYGDCVIRAFTKALDKS